MDTENLDNQKDFKILYFLELDRNNCQTDFAFLLDIYESYSTLNNQKFSALQLVEENNCPTDNPFIEHIFEHDYSPLKHQDVNNSQECLALQFSPDNECVCPEDYQFNNIFEEEKVKQLWEVMSADNYKLFDWYYANIAFLRKMRYSWA